MTDDRRAPVRSPTLKRLLRLSSGIDPEEIPEACRPRLLSMSILMLLVSVAGAVGMGSLLLETDLASSVIGVGAGIGVCLGLAVFLIAFDRSIVTTPHPRFGRLDELVSRGLHGALIAYARSKTPRPTSQSPASDDETAGESESSASPEDDTAPPSAEPLNLEPDQADELSEEHQQVLRDYLALHARPVAGGRLAAIGGRVLLSLTIALFVSHGIDVAIFGHELRAQARGPAEQKYDEALGAVHTQRAELNEDVGKASEEQKTQLADAKEENKTASAALLRQNRAKACPHGSAARKGSVCESRRRAVKHALAMESQYQTNVSERKDFVERGHTLDATEEHLQNKGVDGFIKDQRGILADVQLLIDYFGHNHNALLVYIIVFGILLSVDLSPVLLKLGTWEGEWEQFIASAALTAAVTRSWEQQSRAATAPGYADAAIHQAYAENRRRRARDIDSAEQAEAELSAHKSERFQAKQERKIANNAHRTAVRVLLGDPEIVRRARMAIRERLLERFRRREPTAAQDDGWPASGMADGDRHNQGPRFADDVPRFDGERFTVNEHVAGQSSTWIVVDDHPVERGRNQNSVYRVQHADNRAYGFLKLYALPPRGRPDSNEQLDRLYDRADNEISILRTIKPRGLQRYFLPEVLDTHGRSEEQMGRLWTVTAWHNTPDLQTYVRNSTGAWPLLKVLDLMTDVMLASETSDIIHRDLKPANIMCLPDGSTGRARFQVIDWETGHRPERGRPVMVQFATPGFVAPDVGQNPSLLDDLYSLGATVWFMCTGWTLGEAEGLEAAGVDSQGSRLDKRAARDDLHTLAIHRSLDNAGSFVPLRELLPVNIPVNFSKYIDRLLMVPRDRRGSSGPVSEVAGRALREIESIRQIVVAAEHRTNTTINVGPALRRKPRTQVKIDDEWSSVSMADLATPFTADEPPEATSDHHRSNRQSPVNPDDQATFDGESIADAGAVREANDSIVADAKASRSKLRSVQERLEREMDVDPFADSPK